MYVTRITPAAYKSSTYKKQEPAFQGLFPSANRMTKNAADIFINKNSCRLGVSGEDVKKYFTPLNNDRMTFFSEIVKRINLENYEHGSSFDAVKDLNTADRLYNAVANPSALHLEMIQNRKYSISDAGQIFKLTEENPENLKALENLFSLRTENSLHVDFSAQDIIDILSSGKTKKLNKELNKYKSFIILNNSTPEFTQKLIGELGKSKPDFDANLLDKIVMLKDQHINSSLTAIMDEAYLAQNYNKYGIRLLSNPSMEYKYRTIKNKEISSSDDEFLKYALATTTKDNIKLRKYYINNSLKSDFEKDEWSEHAKSFFERLDADEDFRKIYKYISQANTSYNTPEELMYFADIFTPKLLASKVKNFYKIIRTAPYEARKEDIVEIIKKNLNNKFYISQTELTDSKMQDEYKALGSLFPNLTIRMRKLKRAVKYNVLPKIFGTGEEITAVNIKPADIKPENAMPVEIKPETVFKPKKVRRRINTPKIKYEQVALTEIANSEKPVMPEITKPLKKAAKPKVQQSTEPTPYQIKRQQIKEDGLKLLQKKMHTKRDLGKEIRNFTKMRNGFLDEMFAALKELRQQDRANGIKYSKNTSEDVIELYQKINGKNRKLVKSMLTARTADGKRKFDLKQIADMITPAYPHEKKLSNTGKNLVQSVMYRIFSKNEVQAQ